MYAALKQTPPEPSSRGAGSGRGTGTGGGRGTGAGETGSTEPASASATTPGSRPSARGQAPRASTPGGEEGATPSAAGQGRGLPQDPEARARLMERMQSLPPDQREQMLQRMRGRGGAPTASTGTRRGGRGAVPEDTAASRNPTATTIDALFGPLTRSESTGRVWLYVNNQLQPERVRLGITDGQATELLEGNLEPGTQVVTNVTTGSETRPAAAQGGFPFMGGPPGGGRGGFGGPGGGNRGGGR
jgi:hypothetical protein